MAKEIREHFAARYGGSFLVSEAESLELARRLLDRAVGSQDKGHNEAV